MGNKIAADSRLLDVAIDHFGRLGLSGASTRAIARDAGTPMSSITYHFGGKEGLYLAAAEHIAEQVGASLEPAAEEAERACERVGDPARARQALHSVYRLMVDVLVGADTAAAARFILREQADPTEAFTRIYDRVMAPLLSRMTTLLGIISRGRLKERERRIRALTLAGQVLVFRAAREATLRGMGWTRIGAHEVEMIQQAIADNLDAVLDRIAGGDSA